MIYRNGDRYQGSLFKGLRHGKAFWPMERIMIMTDLALTVTGKKTTFQAMEL